MLDQPKALQDTASLRGRSLLSILDLEPASIERVVADSIRQRSAPLDPAALAGRSVAMLFEKPSLRTRASFEFGLRRLGADVVYFDLQAQRIGQRESVMDYAKNLERWCDAIVARVHGHGVLEQLSLHASIPVVNALSDAEHPCQALADLVTLRQHLGTLRGKRLAFVGAADNVCHSLMLAAGSVGMIMTVITPEADAPDPACLEAAHARASASGGRIRVSYDIDAVRGQHAVYTDTWLPMGSAQGEAESRLLRCEPYRVDSTVMRLAGDGMAGEPLFMHCLPAERGAEVTAEVIDGPSSVVYDQAENRMHAQNALMRLLLADDAEV
ncbi:MAG: ornithine carbamoyltransferase [Planctomycetota bacterium]